MSSPIDTQALYLKRKQDYAGPFCCFDMDSMINEDDDPLYNLNYDEARREYYLKSLQGPYIMTIDYCAWCGKKLPSSLRTSWGAIIRNELGLNPNNPDDRALIPEDFFTEIWWKKRGL